MIRFCFEFSIILNSGKDEIGLLEIICLQGQEELEILIRDDGRGIDSEGVLNKAVEKGIVDENKAKSLTKDEAYALIFRPNFSTRKEVSEISGRGVGMDVVKQNLDEMEGKIKVSSELGKGTEISLRIPTPKKNTIIRPSFITDKLIQFIELNGFLES